MTHTRYIFTGLTLLLSTAALRAAASDSLAGKILHTREAQVTIRTARERALRLNPDGTYTTILLGYGSALNLAPWMYFIVPPASSGGTYSYVRLDESTASLSLTGDGTTSEYTLSFDDNVSGRMKMFPGDVSTFYLTEHDEADRAPLINVSLRGRVSNGHPLIGGLIVPGSHPRLFLIRVVGPSLAQFGVSELWADPDFTIYDSKGPESLMDVHYSDWDKNPYYSKDPYDTAGGITYLFKQLGLFELSPNSKDAVALVWLAPGAHTIVSSAGAGDPGGEALIEVYSIP